MTTIPTIIELYNDILADLQSTTTITIPLIGPIFLRAMAGVQAARLKLYYLQVAFLQRNIFIDTADPPSRGGTLYRYGFVKLNRLPFPARQGQYSVTVTGTSGTTIPGVRTVFKSDATSTSPGFLFILDADYVMPGATGTMTLRALTAGVEAALSVGDTLSATAPIASVSGSVVVTAITVQALAAETDEEYRANGLQAYRLEPQGGSPPDYRIWASDAQGVKRVYPYALSGSSQGDINLFVEALLIDSTDGMGTPTPQILADVAADVETNPVTGQGRRPMGVFQVHTLAVTIRQVDITITGGAAFTTAQQTLVVNGLIAYIATVRPFIAGADVLADKRDTLDTYTIASSVLASVPGAVLGSVAMTIDGTSFPSFLFIDGNIPFLDPAAVHFI